MTRSVCIDDLMLNATCSSSLWRVLCPCLHTALYCALMPDHVSLQVAQPFDGGKFNFNKALQKEVLFQFEPAAEASFDPMVPVTESPTLVYINVSPIEYGHVLLVPRVLDCLPQASLPGSR